MLMDTRSSVGGLYNDVVSIFGVSLTEHARDKLGQLSGATRPLAPEVTESVVLSKPEKPKKPSFTSRCRAEVQEDILSEVLPSNYPIIKPACSGCQHFNGQVSLIRYYLRKFALTGSTYGELATERSHQTKAECPKRRLLSIDH